MHDERPPLDRLNPDDLPRLAIFLTAYFDGDHAPRAGSVAEAAYHYVVDAELDELQELARDWEVLRAAAAERPLEEVQRALRDRFGSHWTVASRDEIETVAAEFERALRE